VADVAIIDGTAPFVTAAVAVIVLGERTTSGTLWCSAVVVIGVAVMCGGSSFVEAFGCCRAERLLVDRRLKVAFCTRGEI
jgi:drug/metabolite transporter (DMT)-like permease